MLDPVGVLALTWRRAQGRAAPPTGPRRLVLLRAVVTAALWPSVALVAGSEPTRSKDQGCELGGGGGGGPSGPPTPTPHASTCHTAPRSPPTPG
jgi:hypothetical protein